MCGTGTGQQVAQLHDSSMVAAAAATTTTTTTTMAMTMTFQ
jgi:hypothetical protein